MKIRLCGDTAEIISGLRELCGMLSLELCDEGMELEAKMTEENLLKVIFDGRRAVISFHENCQFFRGLGLFVEHFGEGSIDITERPQFRMNGPMFDMSQGNAAFNIKTLKSILRQLALMGLNTLMLYCEDSFEVKEQPYFGYMRARYTEDEMRQLDDYAYSLGIEMIPCIQTLAHMPDALRWGVYDEIRDYDACLLVGKEETYKYIKDLLTAATRPFRTKKIHIGMDEAWTLGRGRYIDVYGYKEPGEIMAEHLKRVYAMVMKMGLEPMMWDDMFFRTFGNREYYQFGAKVPEETKAAVPEKMKCVYWDYYHLKEQEYEDLIRQHRELTENVVFAGACWTWVGFSLAWNKTKKATEAALNACKKLGVKDVFMTTWGDNGTECLINTNLIGCQLFAEHGYSDIIDYDKFTKRFKFCTGGNVEDFALLELFDKTPQNESMEDHSSHNASKYLMWQDILTGLCDKNIEGYPMDEHYRKLTLELKEAVSRNGQFDGNFEFSHQAAMVLEMKSEMGLRLTEAYKKGDKEALKNFAMDELPELAERVLRLRKIHKENWFRLYKAFGWDIMDMRYGSLLARITSAIEEVMDYLDGKLEKIEELEAERLYFNGKKGSIRYMNAYGKVASPSRIAPDA